MVLTALECLLFVVVGGIVSLDVAGLTAVKPETYIGTRRDIIHWAARNGFWHAALLFVYGLFAVGLFDLTLPALLAWLIAWLPTIPGPDWLVDALVAIAVETRGHFAVFFALATIAIVWQAYRRKIVENPLAEDSEGLDWQRRGLRAIMRTLRFPATFIKLQLQSVAVAMDMLALAFLLKSLNLFAKDWTRVAAISAIIFITVAAVTWTTAVIFRKQFGALLRVGPKPVERRKTIREVLLIIRLTEPLLIFYFISELVAYLIWHRMASSSLFFLGSALLVFSLIKSVSFRSVNLAVDDMVRSLLSRAEAQ